MANTAPASSLLDLLGVRYVKSSSVAVAESRTVNFTGSDITAVYNANTGEIDVSVTSSAAPIDIVTLEASRTMLATDIGKEILVPSANSATIVYTVDATLFSTVGEWIAITMLGSGSLTMAELDGNTDIKLATGKGLAMSGQNTRATLEHLETTGGVCILTGEII